MLFRSFDQPRKAVYEAVSQTFKPAPVMYQAPAIEAVKEAPSVPAEAVVDDDDLVGFREAIEACTTEAALKVVGDQIKKRGIKGAPAKELRDLFAKQKAAIAVPVVDESQPAIVTEVE